MEFVYYTFSPDIHANTIMSTEFSFLESHIILQIDVCTLLSMSRMSETDAEISFTKDS